MTLLDLPNTITYVVDGLIFVSHLTKLVTQFNLNRMVDDSRLSIFTCLSSLLPQVNSVSTVFPSTVWLERELQEFSGISFLGLSDTRRLLLDYLEHKGFCQTHLGNDKNFNNNFYDVIF
jgi:NADH:ubiquinone oxidoreductase subunit C